MANKYKHLTVLTGTAAMLLGGVPLEAAHLLTEADPLSSSPTQLIAQTPAQPDVLVPNPTITIEDRSHHENMGTDPTIPPAVPMTPPAPTPPPFLPRAVAPPVGDIAISNIDPSLDRIDLGTGVTIPRLVLRDAPVEEVLKLLARNAGLNVIFTDSPTAGGQTGGDSDAQGTTINPTVSLDIENQSVEEVFNSVLLISGLKANRRGNTIFIGAALPEAARNLVSRTLRLNQVTAENAALYLASQGAEVQRLITPINNIRGEDGRITDTQEFAPELRVLTAEQEKGSGALLLNGLKVTSDDRLNSINLVGSPRQVEIATAYLVQLDARRRQVSVNVKVIDVNLNNINRFNSSFSFGFDDGFFVQDQGTAILNFGNTNPPRATQARGSVFYPTVTPFDDSVIPGIGDAELVPFFDQQNAPFGNVVRGENDFTGRATPYSRAPFGRNNNPFQPGLSDVDIDTDGLVEYTYELPSLFQYPSRFLLTLEAEVQSGNAKILTDPTLVVQEGQIAEVQLTQQVITSVNSEVDPESGVRTTTPVISAAGLTLEVLVERIDDNGFINFFVLPEVSAPGSSQQFESGPGAVNTITLLNRRSLSSGLIRLRDGQTLILSGIIQDSERTTVSKVPILGDIPVLGALFRSTNQTNDRREVIIMLTPKLVDENAGYGSNYRPGPDARQMLQQRGFTVPAPGNLE